MRAALGVVVVLIVAGVSYGQDPNVEGPPVKSVHLLNLPSGVSEAHLLSVFRDVNKAIAELGYKGAGYRLWKLQDSPKYESKHLYLWEGNWPSQAAYDAIHESDGYKKALASGIQTLKEAMVGGSAGDDHVYLRYTEVVLPSKEHGKKTDSE